MIVFSALGLVDLIHIKTTKLLAEIIWLFSGSWSWLDIFLCNAELWLEIPGDKDLFISKANEDIYVMQWIVVECDLLFVIVQLLFFCCCCCFFTQGYQACIDVWGSSVARSDQCTRTCNLFLSLRVCTLTHIYPFYTCCTYIHTNTHTPQKPRPHETLASSPYSLSTAPMGKGWGLILAKHSIQVPTY